MQVERSAAFGHIYTVIPGPGMNADELMAARSQTVGGDAAASGIPAAVGSPTVQTTPTSAGSAASQAARTPAPLPPLAFSLAGFLSMLQSPGSARDQRITIDDPVELLVGALRSNSPLNGAAQTATGSANAISVSGSAAPGSAQEKRGLALSVYRRNDLLYLEMADHGLLLVIRAVP